MNKCCKFRIQKWLLNASPVYTPQMKKYFLWWDLVDGFDTWRGFVTSEEKAREVIEKRKQKELDGKNFEARCKAAQATFEKETICVE